MREPPTFSFKVPCFKTGMVQCSFIEEIINIYFLVQSRSVPFAADDLSDPLVVISVSSHLLISMEKEISLFCVLLCFV